MNPVVNNVYENNRHLYFTLSDVDTSIANAVRRTILSDIPTVVIRTETNKDNQCTVHTNTSRLHNEIIKHRLSCIPIHTNDPGFVEKYVLEVDVKNNSAENSIRWVTTKDFRLREKTTDQYLAQDEVHKIFPPDNITNDYILFARLRPGIGQTIPGEHLKLTAEFSVASAKINSMFNVVSKCAYQNTPNTEKISEMWDKLQAKYESEGMSEDEIRFEKLNYQQLNSQRIYKENSFDFVIKTIGVYGNYAIVNKACEILCKKMEVFMEGVESDTLPIFTSDTSRENGYSSVLESSMEYSFDIILENEDYTLGKVLEYLLYTKYYEGNIEELFSYCGFKKYHPHDTYSVIRIAFKDLPSKIQVKTCLMEAGKSGYDIFSKIKKMFKGF
jgi:DNA-directed RNA polymerase subunit L